MGLHIAAWILIHWMLTIAWLDSTRLSYVFWAGLAAVFWWLGWVRRNPPWPVRPEQRLLIYGIFLASTFVLAVFMDRWQGWLIFLEIILLWVGEQVWRRRAA